MDLNRLYFDHQASLIAADRSPTPVSRRACLLSASAIAARIGVVQSALGAEAAERWQAPVPPDEGPHQGSWQNWRALLPLCNTRAPSPPISRL